MAVTRWTFSDGVDTFTFPLNPDESDSPPRRRNIGFRSTCAPDGGVIVFDQRREPQTMSFSGKMLDEDHVASMYEWSDPDSAPIITMTDDLGRSFSVIIVSFQPKRARSATWQWKHTYSVEVLILAET